MAEATKKNPLIDNLIKNTLGVDRVACISKDICTMCGKPATEFKDALSRKEYQISGMCQACQDDFFKED